MLPLAWEKRPSLALSNVSEEERPPVWRILVTKLITPVAAFGPHFTVCRVDIKWFSEPNHSSVLNLTGQGSLSSVLHPNPFLPIPCLHTLLCLTTPHTAYTELSFSCPLQVVSGLCICYPIFLSPGRYLLILPVA